MLRTKRIIACLLVVVLIMSAALPAFAATKVTMQTKGPTNVRSGPGSGYSVRGILSGGTKVTGYSGKGKYAGWVMINYKGKAGYVALSQLVRNSKGSMKIRITSTCTVRAYPSKSSARKGYAGAGNVYTATQYYNGWLKISGGWVWGGYCKKV